MTSTRQNLAPVAIVTGASRGLGRALARSLANAGWRLVLDARRESDLEAVSSGLPHAIAIAGDITDPHHRAELATAAEDLGGIDLLVNNASELGPSPLPRLADLSLVALREVFETNVIAPVALIQLLLPPLRRSRAIVLNISSDAAIEAYAGWGGYGSSKAALDQLSAVLAVEEPSIRCYALDPGDMRTDMHQLAFPGEDISDRPEPEAVIPALLALLSDRPPSGRHRLVEWTITGPAADVAS
jgi:NAD(P)-dependent dehydrogenase (short-subunit alcohol dehydrogenase family)